MLLANVHSTQTDAYTYPLGERNIRETLKKAGNYQGYCHEMEQLSKLTANITDNKDTPCLDIMISQRWLSYTPQEFQRNSKANWRICKNHLGVYKLSRRKTI